MSRWKTNRSAKLKYEMYLQNIEAGSSGSEEELVAVQPQEQGETDDQLEPLQAVQLPVPTIAGDGNAMAERASPSINGELSSENYTAVCRKTIILNQKAVTLTQNLTVTPSLNLNLRR